MGLATALGGSSSGGLLGTIFGTPGNNQPQYLSNGALNPLYQAATKGILDYFPSFSSSSSSSSPSSSDTLFANYGTNNINSGYTAPNVEE
jgi:hypothetical protein